MENDNNLWDKIITGVTIASAITGIVSGVITLFKYISEAKKDDNSN